MKQTADTTDWTRHLRELECDEEMTLQFLDAVNTQNADLAASLLRRRKRTLLESLHASEKKVDLADFLLYQLKKSV